MTNPDQMQDFPAVINLAPALSRLENDRDLLCDLARFYLEDSPLLISELRRGIKTEDFELITRSAHSLKGLAANFDAHAAVAVAFAVEQGGREQQLKTVQEKLPELEETVQQVATALQTQLLDPLL